MVALSVLHVTLTLPGIAGIVLSVGMAVDANVVIFEKNERRIDSRIGHSLSSSTQWFFEGHCQPLLMVMLQH